MDNLDTIEKYLNDKLSNSDRLAFEHNITTDPVMGDELLQIKTLKMVAERSRILEQAKIIHDRKMSEFSFPTATISLKKIGSWVAAASLISLLYVGNSSFSTKYFNEGVRGEITSKSEVIGTLNRGIADIEKQHYLEAEKKMNLLINDPSVMEYYQDAARWYKAVAMVEIGDNNDAKHIFKDLEKSNFFNQLSFADKLRMRLKLIF